MPAQFSLWSTCISFSEARDGAKDSNAGRLIFPCFLYEEAFVKTGLVTLSDRRQARLTDRLFKKRLQAQEFTVPTKWQSL